MTQTSARAQHARALSERIQHRTLMRTLAHRSHNRTHGRPTRRPKSHPRSPRASRGSQRSGTAATASHAPAAPALATGASAASTPTPVAAAPPPGPASATCALGAHRAREPRGCAWSGGGVHGCHGAVEVVEGKPVAAQAAREKRPALVRRRRGHGIGTPAGVGRGQAEAGFGPRLSTELWACSEKRSKQSAHAQLRTGMRSS